MSPKMECHSKWNVTHNRAREWQQAARRLDKETSRVNWHKLDPSQISAPLIIDPTHGRLTAKLKEACKEFQKSSGIYVTVRERAGCAVRTDAKSEPLRQKGCNRLGPAESTNLWPKRCPMIPNL